jgi:ferredoxin
MIDSASLYYFSGTGNSEKISLTFYKFMRDQVKSACSVHRIEDHIDGNKRPVLQNSIVGLITPIYFHILPKIVMKFLKSATFAPYTNVFIIGIPSSNHYLNRTALLQAASIIQKKGGIVYYENFILMPRNYIFKYPNIISNKLNQIADKRISAIVTEILKLKERKISKSLIHFIFQITNIETYNKSKVFGKNLSVLSNCIKCGLCIRQCPTKNIEMDIGIKFRNNCTLCMKCIYSCPVNSIQPVKFNSLQIPGGYNLEISINSPFAKDINELTDLTVPKNVKIYIQKYS